MLCVEQLCMLLHAEVEVCSCVCVRASMRKETTRGYAKYKLAPKEHRPKLNETGLAHSEWRQERR